MHRRWRARGWADCGEAARPTGPKRTGQKGTGQGTRPDFTFVAPTRRSGALRHRLLRIALELIASPLAVFTQLRAELTALFGRQPGVGLRAAGVRRVPTTRRGARRIGARPIGRRCGTRTRRAGRTRGISVIPWRIGPSTWPARVGRRVGSTGAIRPGTWRITAWRGGTRRVPPLRIRPWGETTRRVSRRLRVRAIGTRPAARWRCGGSPAPASTGGVATATPGLLTQFLAQPRALRGVEAPARGLRLRQCAAQRGTRRKQPPQRPPDGKARQD